MKKLFITLAAAVAFAACSDDPAAWEKLPVEPISGESAALTVNGEKMEAGTVQLTATSATQGTLKLTNVLYGYDEITMEVGLTERTDGTGTFDIKGETGLTKIPAINVKAAEEPAIYNVSVTGSISPEGTVAVNLTSVLSPEAQGGLTGTWNMLTNLELKDGLPVNYPLWITWSAQDTEKANAEQLATTVRTIGSPLLYQFLHSLTFLEDGTITAKYWDGKDFDIATGVMNCLFYGIEYEYDDNYNVISASMHILREDPQWLESPKKLLYWYVKGDSLYIVPDIAAILAQIKEDSGREVSGGMDGITSLLAGLGEYGIDVNALMQLIPQWMETGIQFKYEKTENGLKLYADKEMCRPVVEALLPALPKLDELIAGLANSEDPMMQMLPMLLPTMLRIDNLAALEPIWNDNTKEFEVSLNFEK